MKNDIFRSAINMKFYSIFSGVSSRQNSNTSGGSLMNYQAIINYRPLLNIHKLPSSRHVVFAPDKTPGLTVNVT